MPAAHSVRHQAPRSEQAAPFQAVAAEPGEMSSFQPWRGSFGGARQAQSAFAKLHGMSGSEIIPPVV
jgi:hypothetical protein